MIWAFGFQKYNISTKTTYSLENISNKAHLWGIDSIEKYVKRLILGQPEYIVGFGIYSRDSKFLRMETECSNKFRNNGGDIVYPLSMIFEEDGILKYSKSIGNGYCNYASYRIMQEIVSGRLKSKFAFVHIPKKFKVKEVVACMQNKLNTLI